MGCVGSRLRFAPLLLNWTAVTVLSIGPIPTSYQSTPRYQRPASSIARIAAVLEVFLLAGDTCILILDRWSVPWSVELSEELIERKYQDKETAPRSMNESLGTAKQALRCASSSPLIIWKSASTQFFPTCRLPIRPQNSPTNSHERPENPM
jgi:hypothetical protein